jgi:hypothetical protein
MKLTKTFIIDKVESEDGSTFFYVYRKHKLVKDSGLWMNQRRYRYKNENFVDHEKVGQVYLFNCPTSALIEVHNYCRWNNIKLNQIKIVNQWQNF